MISPAPSAPAPMTSSFNKLGLPAGFSDPRGGIHYLPDAFWSPIATLTSRARVTATRREGRKLFALKDRGGWNEHQPWDSAGFLAMRSSAAMRSSSLARSRPNRSAPGLKITPCLIVKGPLGPSTLMGFVQHQAPSGWRRNRLRNSTLVIMALAPTYRADDTRIQERRPLQ